MNNYAKGETEFFKSLAHPLRISIVEILIEGGKSVGELCALTLSNESMLSQQLKILRYNNIVVTQRDGNRVIYSIKDKINTEKLLVLAKQILINLLKSSGEYSVS